MSIQVNETPIAALLYGTDLYRVPLYQRDFAWRGEEIAQFWEDVRRSTYDPQPYFFGSFILVGTSNNTLYEVLDGQQRLAAFTLLLAAARDVLPQSDTKWHQLFEEGLRRLDIGGAFGGGLTRRLHLNRRDDEYLASILDGAAGKPQYRSHRLLRAAYEFLKKEIASLFQEEGHDQVCSGLQKALTERLRAIRIVMSDPTNAQMVFEAVNSAGLDLSQADLVKNHILRSAPDTEAEHLFYKWEDLVSRIEEIREQVTDFIRTSHVSRYGFLRKQDLYKAIRQTVDAKTSPKAYLNGLLEDARLWSQLRSGGFELGPTLKERVSRDVADLRTFNVKLAVPVLLAMGRWAEDVPEHFADGVRWLRDFFVRYSIVAGLPSNAIEQDFSKWAVAIRRGSLEPDELRNLLRERAPGDEGFRESFEQFAPQSPRVARVILARINDHLEPSNVITKTLDGGGVVHLEHVIPQSPENWQSELEEFEASGLNYDEVVHNIAHLTLLPPGINIEAGNLSFAQKRWAYEGRSGPDDPAPLSPAPINRALAQWEQFGPAEFEERREWLASQAVAVWTL